MRQPSPAGSFRGKPGIPDTPRACARAPSGARGWSRALFYEIEQLAFLIPAHVLVDGGGPAGGGGGRAKELDL
jgi:hypothetical protein